MINGLLLIGLIRVGGQKIEIGGQNFLCGLFVIFEDKFEFFFDLLVLCFHRCGHLQRNRDLLVLRQVLAHVGQGKKRGLVQQEAGIDQRRDARQKPGVLLALHGTAVGIVFRLLFHIDVLDHAVLRIKFGGMFIPFVVLAHLCGADPVEEMEYPRAVPVDQGGGHAYHLFCRAVELGHGFSLARLIGVFVKFIHNQAIDFAFVLAFDVGAQRISAVSASGWKAGVRVVLNLIELLELTLSAGFFEVLIDQRAVNKAVIPDLGPLFLPAPGIRIQG